MKKIMAVYDTDPFYADRFADFVNNREKIPLNVISFTSMERLLQYAEKHEIEILLVSSEADRKEVEDVRAARVILLSDGSRDESGNEFPAVYKYQSSDSIIREVMACYGEGPIGIDCPLFSAGKVIGVYSPVNRCLKTSFALTLGQLLSQEEKTLYVNLEDCSGLSALMNEMFRGDLSDVLYFYRQGKYNWARLSSIVYTWGSLDYIPPARYPEDLCQMEVSCMADFLADMAKSASYKMIVVDVGQFGRMAADLLEICDTIYMPVRDDTVSAAKIAEFDRYLELSGHSQIKDRIQKVKLPPGGAQTRGKSYMDQLLWGELGDYVRTLLKGGAGDWEKE
ncbi:hypothetical protein [Clostridium sp. AM58-1XD]|uniref:hypothetical protein n=1 Tax=Clostridium sp. AM58-1XD TaxID=2292307 RepID=UPI000E4D4369|nr:hypothetical protein [Clostridium sp. AM58-1XD]RGY97359.1 hypothetical protein DXA13_14640 [Clostridium sp. AM58-1XD]